MTLSDDSLGKSVSDDSSLDPRLLSEEFELLYEPSDDPQSQLVAGDEEIIVE